MPNIRHAVLIQSSPENIYNAITTQQGLAGWWTPGVTTTGEIGSIARFAFGPSYFKEMKITSLKPFEEVRWNCIAGASEWIGTEILFMLQSADIDIYPEMAGQAEQLKPAGEATLLRFHHDNWQDQTVMFAECSYTWAQFMRSLKLFCETGVGLPWPQQHRVD